MTNPEEMKETSKVTVETPFEILYEDNHIIVVQKPQMTACCPDESKDDNLLDQIKNYIKAESEQVKTLAALYPAEELEARLARYEKATIGSKGKLVYYIVADRPISEKIRNVIRKDA